MVYGPTSVQDTEEAVQAKYRMIGRHTDADDDRDTDWEVNGVRFDDAAGLSGLDDVGGEAPGEGGGAKLGGGPHAGLAATPRSPSSLRGAF